MELIGHDTSTLTALFIVSRPQGQLPSLYALGEMVKRYGFAVFPKVDQPDVSKLEFARGIFNGTGIESFTIYNDGVVATSKSPTDFLDEFVADITEWMGTALGLKRVETHAVSRAYESTLLVRTEAKLLKALNTLTPIQELITEAVKGDMGISVKFEPFGIVLASDYSLIPSMKPGSFRLERKAGLAFDTNYYVSQAPMRTADHLKLLEKLEKMAS